MSRAPGQIPPVGIPHVGKADFPRAPTRVPSITRESAFPERSRLRGSWRWERREPFPERPPSNPRSPTGLHPPGRRAAPKTKGRKKLHLAAACTWQGGQPASLVRRFPDRRGRGDEHRLPHPDDHGRRSGEGGRDGNPRRPPALRPLPSIFSPDSPVRNALRAAATQPPLTRHRRRLAPFKMAERGRARKAARGRRDLAGGRSQSPRGSRDGRSLRTSGGTKGRGEPGAGFVNVKESRLQQGAMAAPAAKRRKPVSPGSLGC